MKPRAIVGVDEVGRGALAGPAAVGAVWVAAGQYPRVRRALRAIKDSKQLTPAQREAWARTFREMKHGGLIDFRVAFVSAAVIDARGIVLALRRATSTALSRLAPESARVRTLLDYGLSAPARFADQTQFVRGDEREPLIAAASILAKVARDARMVRADRVCPGYDFASNKGYSSLAHRRTIRRLGLSPFHRGTFCRALRRAK